MCLKQYIDKTTKCSMLASSDSRCAEKNGLCVDPTTCPCHYGKFKSYQCDDANPSHRCCTPRSKTDISNWEPCQPTGMYTFHHNRLPKFASLKPYKQQTKTLCPQVYYLILRRNRY